MPDCDYCGDDFDSEDAYLEHLAEAHADDLGSIDQRRVDQYEGAKDSGGISTPLLAASVVVALVVGLGGGYAITSGALFSGGSSSGGSGDVPTPYDTWDVHYHGSIEVVVDGQAVDFSQDRYQLQADFFHFEGGDGTRWHGHARGVTLERAMSTLDIGVTDDSVTVQGTTYVDGENADVTVTVDGTDVDPRTYTLEDGDTIRIVVEATN